MVLSAGCRILNAPARLCQKQERLHQGYSVTRGLVKTEVDLFMKLYYDLVISSGPQIILEVLHYMWETECPFMLVFGVVA